VRIPTRQALEPGRRFVLSDQDGRPASLAVSVDVYGDARSHLLQDVQEWHLVPQWRWAVGRSAQLAGVWNNYGITVKVGTHRIAGVTTINIGHRGGLRDRRYRPRARGVRVAVLSRGR
jgi:hypothetical protein